MNPALTLIPGVLIGATAGLIPGLHPNNIAPILITLPLANPELFNFTAAAAAAFTVTSHIPSILLGAPTGENLATLPGHRFTNLGKGPKAVELTLKGTLISILLTPIIAIPFLTLAPEIYPTLSHILPFILISATIITIKKPQGIIITALAGALGLIALEDTTIMPMLTGFFGMSTLAIAITRENQPKKQRITTENKKPLKTTRSATLSTVLSTFFGAIPAISSAITATVGKAFGKMNKEEYLSFIGASNTTYVTISFLTLISLGKTRTGSTVALATTQFPQNPVNTLIVIMVSSSLAYASIKTTLPTITRLINKISYRKLIAIAIITLISLNMLLTNLKGLLVLATATAIGITTIKTQASRINCMASLTIPTALLLL